MSFQEVIIQPKVEGKGRAFKALRISSVTADLLWDMGKSEKHDRPVYAAFAASEGEIRPFMANLICGRPAVPFGSSNHYRRRGVESGYEFMKSAGYKVHYQRHEEGTIATIFLPELLDLDPGMVDPKGIKFVVVPGLDYLIKQATAMPVEEVVDYARALPLAKEANEPERDWQGHVQQGWTEPLSREVFAKWVPLSYLVTLYLSNRSRAPIPPDPKFYMQLLLACFKQGLASLSTADSFSREKRFGHNVKYGFTEEGTEEGGLSGGVAFSATHEEIEAVLAAECADYFARTEGK